MRIFLGMVIMTEKELTERLQARKKDGEEIGFRKGAEAARKGLDDDTRKFMRELGFLNVTDDFWRDKGLIWCLDEGLTWAFPTPQNEQKYMPYHEWHFYGKSRKEIKNIADFAASFGK